MFEFFKELFTKETGQYIELICAGCGKRVRDGRSIEGVDSVVRIVCKKTDCYNKVWNGYIYERDN